VHRHLQRTGHVCRARWQQTAVLQKDCGNSSADRKSFANLIIPFIMCILLYGCEIWSLTLREERRLRVFESMMFRRISGPKRDEVTGEWRQLHNEELNDLTQYCWVIKSRRIRWARHVARILSTGTRAFEKQSCARPPWNCKHVVPSHDNAPSHTSFAVREFLAQHNITTLPHPPYSPDLVPCGFFLFPKLKTHLKGHHSGTVENVQTAATRALNNISSEDFLHCYEEWQQRCSRCFRSQGASFEGDKL